MRAAQIEPGYVGGAALQAARAALWLGDAALLRRAADFYRSAALPGRVNRIGTITLDAGIAALEGRREDAVSAYREALREFRELGLVVAEADVGLDFVTALGPSAPEALTAAEESRAIYARLGATKWLERLDALLAQEAGAPRAGG
jgi:hypothetical protein